MSLLLERVVLLQIEIQNKIWMDLINKIRVENKSYQNQCLNNSEFQDIYFEKAQKCIFQMYSRNTSGTTVGCLGFSATNVSKYGVAVSLEMVINEVNSRMDLNTKQIEEQSVYKGLFHENDLASVLILVTQTRKRIGEYYDKISNLDELNSTIRKFGIENTGLIVGVNNIICRNKEHQKQNISFLDPASATQK